MTLPDPGRALGIVPNPCDWRENAKNWDAVRRLLRDISITDNDGDIISIIQGLLVRFRLNETLAPGGSALATSMNWDIATAAWVDGAIITVYDDQSSDPWQGLEGYEGWARRKHAEDSDAHAIVWMERIAYFITGTLAEDLTPPGPAQATVLAFSDGKDPGETVNVFDVNSRFPEAKQGAAFTAYYDFTAQRYELAVCQQRDWIATCAAAQDFDASDVTVNVNAVTMKSYSEYDIGGEVVTQVRNTFKQIGSSGDPLHIQKSAATGLWEIITAPEQEGGGGGDVVRFRLYGALATGGDALAKLLTWNGAAYVEGAEIRVFDWWSLTLQAPGEERGMFQGVVGMEGFALKRETQNNTPNEYDIIWMEQYPRFICFKLLEDMGATVEEEALAEVVTEGTELSFGQGDYLQDVGQLKVYDPLGMWPMALEGAFGIAVLDEHQVGGPGPGVADPAAPIYIVVSCQQKCMIAGAEASESFCDGQFQVTVNPDSFKPWGFSIFNQMPPLIERVVALNPHGHVGDLGDKLFLVWGTTKDPENNDEPIGGWIICDNEKKSLTVVTSVDWDDDDNCITKTTQLVSLEMCEDPQSGTVLCFEECAASQS